MSGFLSHIAARGMGQAGSVHSAARLPYASAPALVETIGEALAPPPSVRSLSLTSPPQELAQGQLLAQPEASPMGEASAASAPPSPLLQRPSVPAPAPRDVAARNGRNAREAAAEIAAGRPRRRPADSPIRAIPDAIVWAAAQGAEEASSAEDKGPARLRRIEPLLPPQQGLNGTALLKSAPGAQGSNWRTPVEETTEVHVSIGRIEVTAVHEATPAPKRAPARGNRALSLEEYLARRKAGRS
jgi:hypothetical protein